MPRVRLLLVLCAIVLPAALLAGCGSGAAPKPETDVDVTPVSQNLGERIFIDTRFAQFFAANNVGVNEPLPKGDPVVATVQTPNGPVTGPFAGQSINCRSCHFVTEFTGTALGNRTYADFTTRSPIPLAMNGFTNTPRNAMQMVGSFTTRNVPLLLHFDGEFADGADLVKTTLTGRNFGWGPEQFAEAEANIANVIKNDNGNNYPSQTYTSGFSYATMFLGTDSRLVAAGQVLEPQYRIDVTTATDDQIVNAVAAVVAAYAEGLQFKQDESNTYIGSPYDAFLRANHLPFAPRSGQSGTAYAAELLTAVKALGNNATYITPNDGSYKYHSQPYQFGQLEMQGLIIFLSQAVNATDGSQHAGNCAACHTPPSFSDFKFHNNGIAQEEYDNAHGQGSFMNLYVPDLATRNANYDAWLPVTANHPNATETFRHAADSDPNHADLGLWNIFLNPDKPNPQSALNTIVCANMDCSSAAGQSTALASTIAQFKTPILRDLEDSAPYFHNGSRLKFNDVVSFYINSSALAHAGKLRNAPVEFEGMSIDQSDIQALAAFLASLTEDYDDA